MDKKIKVGCIIGTRPEVIKMAPVIYELGKYPEFETTIISTAQHRELLDDMLQVFKIEPHVDLGIMRPNQSLAELTAALCQHLDALMQKQSYDVWFAQGDTTTTFVASLISFYRKVRFGHIEAGLRSFNVHEPFPEEVNRVLVSQIANWNFVPTEAERQNLINEGVRPEKLYITGNTVIDALYWILKNTDSEHFNPFPGKRMILVTAHRRENFGAPVQDICTALVKLSEMFDDIEIVYPIHPNPNIREVVLKRLSNKPRINLLDPLRYDEFAKYMQAAYLIISDSGGIQEEAPALGKPVLVLRNTTERPEILKVNAGKLVGTNPEMIVNTAAELLNDPIKYKKMVCHTPPYGDGFAAERIVKIILQSFREQA